MPIYQINRLGACYVGLMILSSPTYLLAMPYDLLYTLQEEQVKAPEHGYGDMQLPAIIFG